MCFGGSSRRISPEKEQKLVDQQNERAGYKVAQTREERKATQERRRAKKAAKRQSLMSSMTEGQKRFGMGYEK